MPDNLQTAGQRRVIQTEPENHAEFRIQRLEMGEDQAARITNAPRKGSKAGKQFQTVECPLESFAKYKSVYARLKPLETTQNNFQGKNCLLL